MSERVVPTLIYKFNKELQEDVLIYIVYETFEDIFDGEELVSSVLIKKEEVYPNGDKYLIDIVNQNVRQFVAINPVPKQMTPQEKVDASIQANYELLLEISGVW